MGIFDSVDNLFSTAIADVSNIFSGGDQSAGSYLGGSSYGSGAFPVTYQPYSMMPPAQSPVVQTGGASQMLERAMSAGLPRWSVSFPTLWQYIRTTFPFMSPARALSGLFSLLNKFGPAAMTGYLGYQVVSELLSFKATHKRRRMNVANVKALRRGLRRLKGFERLSHRVSAQLGRAARSGRSSRRSRCMTCRKNPCSC